MFKEGDIVLFQDGIGSIIHSVYVIDDTEMLEHSTEVSHYYAHPLFISVGSEIFQKQYVERYGRKLTMEEVNLLRTLFYDR